MKDGYSFHTDAASLKQTYDDMYTAYSNILRRCGLKFRAVEADSGAIGGSGSTEFMVLAEAGEDEVLYTEDGTYAANVEKAVSLPADAVPSEFKQFEKARYPKLRRPLHLWPSFCSALPPRSSKMCCTRPPLIAVSLFWCWSAFVATRMSTT